MKIVIIGLGSMGKRRIRLIRNIYPDCEILGVDMKEDRRNTCEEAYRIVTFEKLSDALHVKGIECAFVCTSPLSHANIIEECLHNDLHVFTEINLVTTKYTENIKLAAKVGRILFLSSTPMYRREMQYIHELVKGLKAPVHYMYHVGQYLPDWHPWEKVSEFFVGDKRTNGCREIMAIELPWMKRTFGEIKDISVVSDKLTNLLVETNDSYLLQISHKNGIKGIFGVDTVCRKAVRRLEIYNEQIYLEWFGKPDTLSVVHGMGKTEYPCKDALHELAEGYSDLINEQAYVDEIKQFFRTISEKKRLIYTFEEDNEILTLIDRIEDGRI